MRNKPQAMSMAPSRVQPQPGMTQHLRKKFNYPDIPCRLHVLCSLDIGKYLYDLN